MIDHRFLLKKHGDKDPYDGNVSFGVEQLAKNLDIRIGKSFSPYVWNGSKINSDMLEDSADIIHEIAHFTLAPGTRRYKPEYGLGPAPETTIYIKSDVVDPRSHEFLASILGCLIEISFGYDHTTTLARHRWIERENMTNDSKEMIDWILRHLVDIGSITTSGKVMMKKMEVEPIPDNSKLFHSLA